MSKSMLLETFPAFRRWSPKLLSEIISSTKEVSLDRNLIMQQEGDTCPSIGFMLSGECRTFKLSETGREITLYETGPGEVCLLSIASVLSNSTFPAMAVASSDIDMLTLEADKFRELVNQYEEMRVFAFSSISHHLVNLLLLITETTFKTLDHRLVCYLIEKADGEQLVTTHQKIAADLGTAREVISRLLKDFERKGMLSLSRNCIRLINMPPYPDGQSN